MDLGPEEFRRAVERLRSATDEEYREALDQLRRDLEKSPRIHQREITDELGISDSGDAVARPATIRLHVAVPMPSILVESVDDVAAAVAAGRPLSLDQALRVIAAMFLAIATGAAAVDELDLAASWGYFSAFVEMLRHVLNSFEE